MSHPRVAIIGGASLSHAVLAQALAVCATHGVELVVQLPQLEMRPPSPEDVEKFVASMAPPKLYIPEDFHPRKETAYDRANRNAPFYDRFRKRKKGWRGF